MKVNNTLPTEWPNGKPVALYDHVMYAAWMNASTRLEAQSMFEDMTKVTEPTWKSDNTAKIKGSLALSYFKDNGIIPTI